MSMLSSRGSGDARTFLREGSKSMDEESLLSTTLSSAVDMDACPSSKDEAESLSCLGDIAKCIINCSKCVIIAWLVLALACVPFAAQFTSVLKINAGSPPGSGAEAAELAFKQYFPPHGLSAQYVGYLETNQDSILDVYGIDAFSRELQRRLNASRPLTNFMSRTMYNDLTAPLGKRAPEMPIPLWSKDKKAMLLTWQTADDATSQEAIEWARGPMHKIFMETVPEYLGAAISFYGTDSYSETAGQAVPVAEADMIRVDILCIPVTTLVLYCLIRSIRLLVIPGATLGVAAVVSYAATFVLGCYTPVMPATPGLMSCLMISVSIDYAIFLLVRFREEIPARRKTEGDESWDEEIEEAICTVMSTSGATILLSGCVLLMSFLFMAFFPINIIASMGIGACIAMTVMMLVNLTLVPALLSEFRYFFTNGVRRKENGPDAEKSCSDKCWAGIAKIITTCPINFCCLFIVVALTLAISYPIMFMQTSGDLRQIVGLGSRLAKVGELVSTKFGGGMAYPIEVLMVPTDSNVAILSEKFFADSSNYVQAIQNDVILNLPEAKESTFNFLTYQSGLGKATSFDEMDTLCLIRKRKELEQEAERVPIVGSEAAALAKDLPMGLGKVKVPRVGATLGLGRAAVRVYTEGEDLRPLCAFFVNAATNTKDYHTAPPTATYGVIVPSIEPMGKLGQKFLDALRNAHAVHGPKHGITAWYGGDAVKNLDMVESLYGTFPKAILATVVTAGLFLAVAFRSLFIPLRSLVSVLLTLGFTYGFTVLTYQYGLLDFLGMSGVNGRFESLPWCAPVIVFFIIFGIALDYDIFLMVRITELRSKGRTPQEAIREGLEKTGGVILAAGMVMACAFTSILFSSMFQQAMFGFMISVAVLYDSLIVLAIVTPAGMSLLGYCNWWPSHLSRSNESDEGSELEDEE